MVKVWIHKPGGTEPLQVAEMTMQDCVSQFDLEEAEYMQELGAHPPTPRAPGPLGADPDPELVVFEVLSDEKTARVKPGYYASHMTADTVQELIGEE
jgi:hypothetical protein